MERHDEFMRLFLQHQSEMRAFIGSLIRDRHAREDVFQEVSLILWRQFEEFDPREFVAQGDEVIAVGHYRAKTKRTGQMVEADWAMLFTIRDGKIARFREFTDSAPMVKAYEGATASV